MKRPHRESAKANTEKDFEFTFYTGIDDALIEGLSKNHDFFTLLLQNPDIKKEVPGIFAGEVYKELRGEGGNKQYVREKAVSYEAKTADFDKVAEGSRTYNGKE